MKKALAFILAVLFILPFCVSCTTKEKSVITPTDGETVLYVSPNGDDTADGTFDAPLATLKGAKNKVRAILPTADGAVSVYFRGGDYLMTEGVTFDETDSGKEGAPVKYAAYPDEEVRFIGGVKVDPALITKADESASVTARVKDETAKAALLQADVSSLVDVYPEIYAYGKEADDAVMPVQIYLGETPIMPARWPNRGGDYDYNYLVTAGDVYRDPDQSISVFYDDDTAERVNTWSDDTLDHLYLYGFLQWDWIGDIYAAYGVNRDEHSIRLTGGTSWFFRYIEGAGRYYFMNIPEEIDLPGESYIDREAKIAYFYPTDDYDPDNVWISTLKDDMLTFTNVSNVTLEGLNLLYTRGDGVSAVGLTDFTMKDCTVAHTSAKAVRIWDALRVTVDGCQLYDTANGGIFLEGGDQETLTSSESLITNCDIHDVNRSGVYNDLEAPTYAGGTFMNNCIGCFATGAVISHNKVHAAPHQVISAEGNDIVIEYNEIYDCVRETSDMAAISYWNNPTQLGRVIRYNYFHDIGNIYAGVGQYSIYADCGSMGAEIYGNLFVDAAGRQEDPEDFHSPKGSVMLNGSQFNHVYNNVFVSQQAAVVFESWAANGSVQSDWILYLYGRGRFGGMGPDERMREVNFDNPLWREHYAGTIWENIYDYVTIEKLDEYQQLSDADLERKARGMAPYNTNEVDNNVYVSVIRPIGSDPVNEHDCYTTDDTSVFADYEGGDFRFTDAALARIREICPGFEELPLDEIGPKEND